jgi:hypothetical protein
MNSEETYTQTSSASAGEPQRPDTQAVRARAEVPNLLRQEVLDERQARFRDKRRTGGPRIEEESAEETREANPQPPDVPPTECQELTE